MKTRKLPTQECLHECFEYLPDGTLIWRIRPQSHFATAFGHSCSKSHAGKFVGTDGPEGYLVVTLGIQYYLHRIIWVMHNGPIPGGYLVDHEDTIRTNNKIENLRLTLSFGNSYNKRISSNNSSGIKGVYWDKQRCRWKAMVGAGKERFYAGSFQTLEEAKIAIENLRNQLHGEFTNHGHFS